MKLCIALIHNNNKERCKHIRPSLERLKDKLSVGFNVEFFEIYKQPDVAQHKTLVTLIKKVFLWRINRKWKEYKDLKPRNIFLDMVILIRRIILTYVDRKRENKWSIIQSFVTGKHIRAWERFLEKEADFLICFEDDAAFKKDSISKLMHFLQEIRRHKNKPIYLDLAGGCDSNTLEAKKLELSNDKLRKYFRKPVTNTACAYLINHLSAEIFLKNILEYPWLRLISIDWVLNKLFILTVCKYTYYCYHANPPIFDHGSQTSYYLSWHNSNFV